MKSSYRLLKRSLLLAVATLPLMQVACTPNLLSQSFANEVITAAVQASFDVSQTVFMNLFGL